MERVARSSVVTAAAVIMVLGALAGFGVLGTRVEDSSGGVFATDATLLTPAGPAFSIWSLIYLGLIAYTAWQWRPSTGTRASGIAWLAAASMVLNAAWILVTQVGWIWASVAVILALAVVLGLLLRRLSATPASGRAELILVDGTFGVYLGWVSVAAVANVTTALVASGVEPQGRAAEAVAALVLVVALALGLLLATALGGRWAVAGAMAWAFAWIAVGRFGPEQHSVTTGFVAIVVALIVLGATARVHRQGSAQHFAPASPQIAPPHPAQGGR